MPLCAGTLSRSQILPTGSKPIRQSWLKKLKGLFTCKRSKDTVVFGPMNLTEALQNGVDIGNEARMELAMMLRRMKAGSSSIGTFTIEAIFNIDDSVHDNVPDRVCSSAPDYCNAYCDDLCDDHYGVLYRFFEQQSEEDQMNDLNLWSLFREMFEEKELNNNDSNPQIQKLNGNNNIPLIQEPNYNNTPLIQEPDDSNIPLIQEPDDSSIPLIKRLCDNKSIPLTQELDDSNIPQIQEPDDSNIPLIQEPNYNNIPLIQTLNHNQDNEEKIETTSSNVKARIMYFESLLGRTL